MRGILKALAVTGLNGKAFGEEIGVDKYMMSKFANGHCNPTPEVFRKICDRSGLPPEAVATIEDVDYGVIPLPSATKPRTGDRHKKKSTLRFRVLPKQRKQVEKDLKSLGFATIQSWGDFCIKQLHVEAERKRSNDP